jgi:hypothetical protein
VGLIVSLRVLQFGRKEGDGMSMCLPWRLARERLGDQSRVLNKPSRDKLKPRLVKPGFSAARLVLVLLKTSRLQAARLVLLVPKLYRGLAPKL